MEYCSKQDTGAGEDAEKNIHESEQVLLGEPEEASRIGGGDPGELGRGEAADLGEPRRGQRDPGRLVGLAAVGMGAQVGAVGLDQEPVERDAGGRGAERVERSCW